MTTIINLLDANEAASDKTGPISKSPVSIMPNVNSSCLQILENAQQLRGKLLTFPFNPVTHNYCYSSTSSPFQRVKPSLFPF